MSGAAGDDAPQELVRHEERLRTGTARVEAGSARVRTHVERAPVTAHVEREVEAFDGLERVPAAEHDSGEIETLPDGSISIPILEEELVITKRLVVRERVIVQKRVVTEHQVIEAELRRERVSIEGDVEQDPSSPRRRAP